MFFASPEKFTQVNLRGFVTQTTICFLYGKPITKNAPTFCTKIDVSPDPLGLASQNKHHFKGNLMLCAIEVK